ncbi:MAG TPA: prepilin-type N-terminal cleavage/methylation domain-containing protein, partial [Acidimicrobiales bacterium]|nr:prepilin-type N-terminal cleavage/methylation domain-containing protein [Acidimicrobiales bacterium]
MAPVEECSGFTLVELLLVIVVLGILAAIVVFSLGSVSASATAASCRADAHIVETAVHAYVVQNDSAPTTADLTASSNPYLDSFPTSPSFTISLSHGVVEVAAPTGSAPVPASSPGACAGLAAAHAGGTTTPPPSSTTTTTTAPPPPPVTVAASTSGGNTPHDKVRLTFDAPVTAWSVTITVSAANGETYRGQGPGSRAYSPGHATSGGTITYTWSFTTARPVKPRPIALDAVFALKAKGR